MKGKELFEVLSPFLPVGVVLCLALGWQLAQAPRQEKQTRIEKDDSAFGVLSEGLPQANVNRLTVQSFYGIELLCGMLNTPRYGNSGSVDPSKPIFDSAYAIFDELGNQVEPEHGVMVIKGDETVFRGSVSGDEYHRDANGTMYCVAPEE